MIEITYIYSILLLWKQNWVIQSRFFKKTSIIHSLSKHHWRTSSPSSWESCRGFFALLPNHSCGLLLLLSPRVPSLFFAVAVMVFWQLPWSCFWLMPSVFKLSLAIKFSRYQFNPGILCTLFICGTRAFPSRIALLGYGQPMLLCPLTDLPEELYLSNCPSAIHWFIACSCFGEKKKRKEEQK